jgi:hypothetical protein
LDFGLISGKDRVESEEEMRRAQPGTLTSCLPEAILMKSRLGANSEAAMLLQDRRSHLAAQFGVIDPPAMDDALCCGHDLRREVR